MEKKDSTLPLLRGLHTIFVDTNFDTHLAMVVSLHDTISDVKAKIMAEHALCFQDIGEISIRTMKVKRRGFFYDLADTMCVWNVFNGFKGSWFVCIDAVLMSPVKSPEIVANKVIHDHLDHYSNEGVGISPCEPEKYLGPDKQDSYNSIVVSRDHEGRAEILIDQIETSNGMPGACTHKSISDKRSKTSQQDNCLGTWSQHNLVEKRSVKNFKDGLQEHFLEDYQGSKFSMNENIDEHLEDVRRGSKTEILAASLEGLPSKLPHDNIPLQNYLVEKHLQRRMRSSKMHEAHLSMPYETPSPQVTLDPSNSGKEGDASNCLEKCPIGPIINLLLPNDGRDIRMAPDTESPFEVTNSKIKNLHSMETCMVAISSASKKPIEDQILQINFEDQREKYANLCQETNGDVRLKKPEEIRIPLQLYSELPSNLYCSTDKLRSRSSKALGSPTDANDQRIREFDIAKCIRLNPTIEDEAKPEDGKAEISALAEKFSYEELANYAVSKNFSDDKQQGLDNEIVAADSLKGINKDRSLIHVESKVRHKSQRIKKKLKTGSSRACESTDINGYQGHFSSDSAQVCWNNVHNESNASKIIKPADQNANGGHCVDTVIKISSSSIEDPNQNQVSLVNSYYPPISMLDNFSEVSNMLAEKAPENRITSHPAFEVQAMPYRSRKNTNSEPSKLGSPEVSDVALAKYSKEVTGSNVGGPDRLKLVNGSNQKIEQHCIDAKSTVAMSDEDSSMLAEMPQMDLLDPSSCKQKDLREQSNAKVIIKGVVTNILSHGALAGPTKYKCGRKKSKKEALIAQVSSVKSEHMEFCVHDDASINFRDYFVSGEGEHVLNVHTPTDLVQSVSHKSLVVESQPQKGDNSHHSVVITAHDSTIKDYMSGLFEQNSNQSRTQYSLSRTESNLFLHEVIEHQELVKEPQDYGPQTHFQLLKSDGMGSNQSNVSKDGKDETLSLSNDCGIDNIVSIDEYVHNNFNSSTRSSHFVVSPSEGLTNQVASTHITGNTPYHLRRFRVARKIPIRRSKV